MSNYIEIDNKYAFHPGYYLREYLDETGYSQEDFANRLDTTPKNISLLIRGEQSLSTEMALKLSRFFGTSVKYWLNLQAEFDSLKSLIEYKEELENEKIIFKDINYSYFKNYFNLADHPRKIEEQIIELRKFLKVSTLCVFKKKDYNARFRTSKLELNESNIVKANIMVQIATNISMNRNDIPKFEKKDFNKTIKNILSLTNMYDNFFEKLKEFLFESGVDLIVLPNLMGSKINGAIKLINNHHIMLMVDDRKNYLDSFWFTLFHEIGHIINNDFGISFENDHSEVEVAADEYAENILINPEDYKAFIKERILNKNSIINFSKRINRDPGIVVGRLQKDKYISQDDWKFNELKKRFAIRIDN
jgi:addiction module HigA family antidote